MQLMIRSMQEALAAAQACLHLKSQQQPNRGCTTLGLNEVLDLGPS